MFTLLRLALVLVAAGWGAVAVPLARGGSDYQPQLHRQDWRLDVPADKPRLLHAGDLFHLPFLVGDHDLWLTVQVPAEGELDLVFRKVEHRADSREPACHARFSLLRLSTLQEGPPFRTREEALFGDVAGGVRVTPGQSITVGLEARGRVVRANVGGRALAPFLAADPWGNTALLVRGPLPAEIRALKLVLHPTGATPTRGIAMLLAAALAGAVAALALWRRAPPLRVLLASGFVPLGALAAHDLVLQHLTAMAQPELAGLTLAALTGLPLFALLVVPRRVGVRLLLGLVLGAVLLEGAARAEQARLEPLADPRLDLYFDEGSGTAAFDAHCGWLRGKSSNHRPIDPRPHVLLLGGQEAIWEIGPEPGRWLAVRLGGELRSATGKPHEWGGCATPATRIGHALQQKLLFERFLATQQPDAVVLGLTPYEAEPHERGSPRARLAASPGSPPDPVSFLLALWQRARSGQTPPSTPTELAQTLTELATLCRERRIPLAFATAAGLPPDWLQAARDVSAREGVRLVPDVVDGAEQPQVTELAAAVRDLLRRQ